MNDEGAKSHLHQKLRAVREALVWKLEGLSEYDIRRPLTSTGTNLVGLVKHNAISDSRYFGEVFNRHSPSPYRDGMTSQLSALITGRPNRRPGGCGRPLSARMEPLRRDDRGT